MDVECNYEAQEEHDLSAVLIDDVLYPSTTNAPPEPTILDIRQLSNPRASTSSTLAALSTALASAQSAIATLQRQNQNAQLQLASLNAVVSAQSDAQTSVSASASSSLASLSSSASAALASASVQIASVDAVASAASRSADAASAVATAASRSADAANAVASAASRSADAALAVASSAVAQAELQRREGSSRFSETQIAIAIVVSIIGTALVSGAAIFCLARYRNRREEERLRKIKEGILRPNTGGSAGSGDVVWDERYQPDPRLIRRPERDRGRDRRPLQTPMSRVTTATPPRSRTAYAPQPRLPVRVEEEPRVRPTSRDSEETRVWPARRQGTPGGRELVPKASRSTTRLSPRTISGESDSPPSLSLFPKVPESRAGISQSREGIPREF